MESGRLEGTKEREIYKLELPRNEFTEVLIVEWKLPS